VLKRYANKATEKGMSCRRPAGPSAVFRTSGTFGEVARTNDDPPRFQLISVHSDAVVAFRDDLYGIAQSAEQRADPESLWPDICKDH